MPENEPKIKPKNQEISNVKSEAELKAATPDLINFEDPRYGEFNDFSNFLAKRVDKGGSGISKISNKKILEKNGLHDIDPESVDPNFYLVAEKFVNTDWDYINKASDKLLALYTVKNFYTNESLNSGHSIEPWGIDKFAPTPEEIGDLVSLPLVYQTKFERLLQILESGKVLSDRAYYQTITEQGKQLNADTLEEFRTHTYGDDRRAGLDNYVFTFFGRPHSKQNYGSVEILFKPDQIYQDQKSFTTQDDFIDMVDSTMSEDAYRSEILQGDYFIRAAGRKLKKNLDGHGDVIQSFMHGSTDTKDQYGGNTFSTWEVKIPQLKIDDIDTIVFSAKEDLQRFRKKYGERYPIILRPDMATLQTIAKDKLGLGDISRYSLRELSDWCGQYFTEHPAELVQYFGSEKVEFSPDNIYRLNDAEERKKKFIHKELERGKEERILTAPETEQKSCYVAISFPKEYITPGSDIYRLNPENIFADLAAAQAELQRKKQFKKLSITYQPGEEDKIKMTIIKVTTIQKELNEYETTKNQDSRFPARLQHYKIDDVIEL
jgi:hypothetical protein